MKKPLVILSLLMTFVLTALAQEEVRTRREPVPNYPPLTKPVIQEIPATDGFGGTSVATGFKPPSATAESVRNTSVHLYTGTPEIQIPIYTLQEGRLSLPIYGSYSTSAIKPQTLAGWLGLGFELKGIPKSAVSYGVFLMRDLHKTVLEGKDIISGDIVSMVLIKILIKSRIIFSLIHLQALVS